MNDSRLRVPDDDLSRRLSERHVEREARIAELDARIAEFDAAAPPLTKPLRTYSITLIARVFGAARRVCAPTEPYE